MTLEDIYTQLSFGELRQLFLAGTDIDDPDAGMPKEHFAKLLPSISLGLTELYKRFFLREGHLTLELVPNKATYVLMPKFAESNTKSAEPVKYLKDMDSPFQDDLFKVERVYGTYREEEYEIPLNEIGNTWALRTTSYNTLLVPTDAEVALWLKETTELHIVYRANHPVMSKHLANAAPMLVEVELPPTHLEALCFYVASRIQNPLGMVPGSMHEGNNYFSRFLASVEELKMQNFEIDDDAVNFKLTGRGFC